MERRNWSLEALKKLRYVDSLDDDERALGLERWSKKYLKSSGTIDLELDLEEYKELSELFYKNIDFLKKFNNNIQTELSEMKKMRAFLQNS